MLHEMKHLVSIRVGVLGSGVSLVSIQACENGRGAVLLSVARGKVSEGVDFGK